MRIRDEIKLSDNFHKAKRILFIYSREDDMVGSVRGECFYFW